MIVKKLNGIKMAITGSSGPQQIPKVLIFHILKVLDISHYMLPLIVIQCYHSIFNKIK